MCDSSGIITEARAEDGGVSEYKRQFARDVPEGGLADAMEGADVFVGLSIGGIVSQEMIESMNENPIVFAMANPDPEISYEDAKEARDDTVIMATGRSDYPNQVNNVLGFPFIFRGALDVRATEINEAMKVACAEALADLARQDVPDAVVKAYGDDPIQYGPEYIIPKPVDPRVLFRVAPAIAEAAMESDAARAEIDLEEYEELEARLGKSRELMRVVLNKAKSDPKTVALAEVKTRDDPGGLPDPGTGDRGADLDRRRERDPANGGESRSRLPARSPIRPSATTRPTPIDYTNFASARDHPDGGGRTHRARLELLWQCDGRTGRR